jgi:hypothetical protein
MKKLLVLLIVACVLFASNAHCTNIVSDAVYLKTIFVNQDPYQAEPGGYVDLLFKVENQGTKTAENVIFELLPEYPFSLDPGLNATRELGAIAGLTTGEDAYFVKYKVRVDKDAIKGDNEISLRYTYGSGGFENSYISEKFNVSVSIVEKFNVSVSDPRTDFDVIVQDSTSASTTLAIANIGANAAYSAIVKIPEQEAFRVTGASANIMGNLDAGEYTLASFQIVANGAINATMVMGNASVIADRENATAFRGNVNATMGGGMGRNLNVEISYTDTLGIRRTVQKEVRLDANFGANGTFFGQARTTQTGQSPISNGLLYIVIGAVGIIAVVLFFKLRHRAKK